MKNENNGIQDSRQNPSVKKQVISGVRTGLVIVLAVVSIFLPWLAFGFGTLFNDVDSGSSTDDVENIAGSIFFLIALFVSVIGMLASIVGWILCRNVYKRTQYLFIGTLAINVAMILVSFITFRINSPAI